MKPRNFEAFAEIENRCLSYLFVLIFLEFNKPYGESHQHPTYFFFLNENSSSTKDFSNLTLIPREKFSMNTKFVEFSPKNSSTKSRLLINILSQ